MLLGNGTVYGKRYYTVAPPLYSGKWRDMNLWCVETFGPSTGSIWADKRAPESGERWYENNTKFWFRNEEDRMWFMLRWL